MKEIRIACCGLWHSHAKDFPMDRVPKACKGLPYRFVCVWDPDPEAGEIWAREMGCAYEADYEKVLRNPEVDAVMITAATTKHAEMVIQAARAGKHIFIEKALSTDPAEARRALRAVKESGVHFTISDPFERPELLKAKEIADSGVLGDITTVRYRCVHAFGLTDPGMMTPFYQKEAAGEGAIFDLGHHAVHVLYWFLGEPDRACAICSPFTERGRENEIDEISAAVYHFPSGTVGIAEAGWLCPGNENIFEIYGTRGFLRWDCDGLRYVIDPSNERGAKINWTLVPSSECPKPANPPAVRYWMESILNETPNEAYSIEDAVKVCEMIALAIERKA